MVKHLNLVAFLLVLTSTIYSQSVPDINTVNPDEIYKFPELNDKDYLKQLEQFKKQMEERKNNPNSPTILPTPPVPPYSMVPSTTPLPSQPEKPYCAQSEPHDPHAVLTAGPPQPSEPTPQTNNKKMKFSDIIKTGYTVGKELIKDPEFYKDIYDIYGVYSKTSSLIQTTLKVAKPNAEKIFPLLLKESKFSSKFSKLMNNPWMQGVQIALNFKDAAIAGVDVYKAHQSEKHCQTAEQCKTAKADEIKATGNMIVGGTDGAVDTLLLLGQKSGNPLIMAAAYEVPIIEAILGKDVGQTIGQGIASAYMINQARKEGLYDGPGFWELLGQQFKNDKNPPATNNNTPPKGITTSGGAPTFGGGDRWNEHAYTPAPKNNPPKGITTSGGAPTNGGGDRWNEHVSVKAPTTTNNSAPKPATPTFGGGDRWNEHVSVKAPTANNGRDRLMNPRPSPSRNRALRI